MKKVAALPAAWVVAGAKRLFWTESRFVLNVTFSYDSEVSVFIKGILYDQHSTIRW